MIRNVRRGLHTRTEIIKQLDGIVWKTTAEISRNVDVTYQTVFYHLKHLEREDVVERDPDGKGWRFGPFQQSELTQFLKSTAKRRGTK